MAIKNGLLYASLLLVGIFLTGCSKSDDQRRFEEQGLQPPQYITKTNAAGDTTGTVDKDDWRIAPMFLGSIALGAVGESQAPFPNPVGFNASIHIHLNQQSLDRVTSLEIYRLTEINTLSLVQIFEEYEINSGLNDLHIPASRIAKSEGSIADKPYRLLIYDNAENLITYGDVQIGSQ